MVSIQRLVSAHQYHDPIKAYRRFREDLSHSESLDKYHEWRRFFEPLYRNANSDFRKLLKTIDAEWREDLGL